VLEEEEDCDKVDRSVSRPSKGFRVEGLEFRVEGSVLAVLDARKLERFWSFSYGSELGNFQQVHGSEFPEVLLWPPLLLEGVASLNKRPRLGHSARRQGRQER